MNDAAQPFDIVSTYWRVVGVGVSVIAAAAIAAQTVRLDVAVESLLAAVVLLGAVRSWRVRLTNAGDVLTVRNVLRTRTLPWASVTAIEVRHGLLSRPGDSYADVGFRTEHGWVRAADPATAMPTWVSARSTAGFERVRH